MWTTIAGRTFKLGSESAAIAADLLRTARIDGVAASDWLKRPGADWSKLVAEYPPAAAIPPDIAWLLEIQIKYEGYIARQDRQIERFAAMETKLIPTSLDYANVVGLRTEARQKLGKFNPRSLGQALRISGITPADVTVLAIHLTRSN